MKIEVSNGEILDKLSIIEIKLNRIKDEKKLKNIKIEHEILNLSASKILDKSNPLYVKLFEIN